MNQAFLPEKLYKSNIINWDNQKTGAETPDLKFILFQ